MNKVSSWSFQNNYWVVFLPWYISWRGLFRFQNKNKGQQRKLILRTRLLFSSTKIKFERRKSLVKVLLSRNIDTNCWIAETSTVANRWTQFGRPRHEQWTNVDPGWVNLNSHSPGLLPRVPFKLPPLTSPSAQPPTTCSAPTTLCRLCRHQVWGGRPLGH